jgi:uncharacterized membrane protein YhaH (DUF805 family)
MPRISLRRLLDFSNRARRTEFWLAQLFVWILVGACAMIAAYSDTPFGGWLSIVIVAVAMLALVPFLALQVRRLHDQDRSGFFVLLHLVPYIGTIIVLIFMCLPGTKGPNAYGPDPRTPD